jgi:chemotaxis regulatin CheY-phosphate phosphatase CheZ
LLKVQRDEAASGELSEIIQAQAFQDVVGQVVNKLVDMVQKMEDSLAHLLWTRNPTRPLRDPRCARTSRSPRPISTISSVDRRLKLGAGAIPG